MENPSEVAETPVAELLDGYTLSGKGIGPVASWRDYDLSQASGNWMMKSVHRLYLNEKYRWVFGIEVVDLARRLAWIMLYFYGAMQHFWLWTCHQVSNQTEITLGTRRNDLDYWKFRQSLGEFFLILSDLPKSWLSPGKHMIINDTKHQQVIPTEAPLELVVEIYLIVHGAVNPLMNPDAVQDILREVAVVDDFPTDRGDDAYDGFSNCIFVTQSDPPRRKITVGSTVIRMRYVDVKPVTESFATLRQRRFIQGPDRHDSELKRRFRDGTDPGSKAPKRRYQDVGHRKGATGAELADFVNEVRTGLIDEYAAAYRERWAPFSYIGQHARSYFAPFVHPRQQHWFEPTPRCLKCRVIHDYNIVGEDLEVIAEANPSCQCAEDIVYVKLRRSDEVGNVILAGL